MAMTDPSATPDTAFDLDAFIATGWDEHADQPDAVAARLPEALPHLHHGPQVQALARLAAHVDGEHRGDWAGGQGRLATLAALPAAADAATQALLRRLDATLRHAGGQTDAIDALPRDDRIAALAGSAAMLAGRGDVDRAIDTLNEALALAHAAPLAADSVAQRALAIAGNNLACTLQEQPVRTPAQDAGMLTAAQAGLTHWTIAGTWLEAERAEHRLSVCLRAAGRPLDALHHAHAGLALCEANGAPPFERFFLEAAAALAAHDAGLRSEAAMSAARALAHHQALPADEVPWCASDLAALAPWRTDAAA